MVNRARRGAASVAPGTISVGKTRLNGPAYGSPIRRAIEAANIARVTALLVHAISEQARRFYLSPGFIASPIKPMTLCLMLATVEQALREPSGRSTP